MSSWNCMPTVGNTVFITERKHKNGGNAATFVIFKANLALKLYNYYKAYNFNLMFQLIYLFNLLICLIKYPIYFLFTLRCELQS